MEKIELTEEQIKEIAEEIESGMKVFLHKKTKKILSLIDDELYIDDDEYWQEIDREIEENYDDYLFFEQMDSRHAYRLMENFVYTVEDDELRKHLELGLRLAKPFSNFKQIISFSAEYRKKWFVFKSEAYIEEVKVTLEVYNNRFDEDFL